MSAVLSSDSLVIVRCKVCTKPVLQSALVGHIENCRRINSTAPLFATSGDAAFAPNTAASAASPSLAAPIMTKPIKEKKEKTAKRKREKESANQFEPLPVSTNAQNVGGKTLPQGVVAVAPPTVEPAPKLDKVKLPKPPPLPKEPRGPKPRMPVDFDKHCGVISDDGLPCIRSITCKMHSVSLKRGVAGRSLPYDTIMSELQSRNRAAGVAGILSTGGLSGSLGANGGIGGVSGPDGGDPNNPSLLRRASILGGGGVILTSDEADKLIEIIRHHRPAPMVSTVASSYSRGGGFGSGRVVTIGGLLSAINARNMSSMLKGIGERRRGVYFPGGGAGGGGIGYGRGDSEPTSSMKLEASDASMDTAE
ncbi:hypothetical protein HDU81_004370 [Chytriomyces hyalinus]|nr:hypothetical protein HDU81_004370 [Chytriomyces hyalinus]